MRSKMQARRNKSIVVEKDVGDVKGWNMDLSRALADELSQWQSMAVGVAGRMDQMGLHSS